MRWSLLVLGLVVTSDCVRGQEKHRVIIVGAGVSGFTAAATLLEHNVTDLVILEASDRIGGRIHTVEFGGVPIDKGAEFVHGEVGNAVFELVSPYDFLASYKPLLAPDKSLFVNTDGIAFDSNLTSRILDGGFEILEDEDPENVTGSVADYLTLRMDAVLRDNNVDPKLSEAMRYLVTEMQCVYNAADGMSTLGARGYAESAECEGDLSIKWKKEGYKTLFDILSKKFPTPYGELPVRNKTILNKQVTRVERKEGDIEVTCADGTNYVADHVIVTPSLGVLKKHAATMFHPALPADKTAAIETLGFGCVGKVFMLFSDRWWPISTNLIVPLFAKDELQNYLNNSLHGSWASRTTGFYPVMNHERMLCAWFSGEACRTMETLSEDQVVDGLMELLDTTVGKLYKTSRPESILRTTWASNSNILGAYSYPTVSSEEQNVNRSHLAEPILDVNGKPVILFAGEATHTRHYATVHGALASGRREANNLLNYFKK